MDGMKYFAWVHKRIRGGGGGGGFKLPTELWRRLLSIGRIGTRTGADFLFFAHVYISPRNILRRFDDYVPEVRPGQSSHIDGGYNA